MLQIFYKEKPIIISDNKTDLKNSLMVDLELLDNIDLNSFDPIPIIAGIPNSRHRIDI